MALHLLPTRFLAFMAGLVLLSVTCLAGADPPSRVGRLGYLSGAISFSPAGESEWEQAAINRPLGTGDRLWTETGARAEIQAGGALIRMDADTGLSLLNLDDQITQLQLSQGVLNVRIRHLEPDEVFEVDTPNLAFTLRQPGSFRIEVDADGNATTLFMRKGQGEAYGENASYLIDARQGYRFMGTGLGEYDYVPTPGLDDFDRWAGDRDRNFDLSVSARYVSRDVVGYQDLDANGTWHSEPEYGSVWYPSRVDADWAPYQDGHWAWVDPWGWTWVDDLPWGFAVSHYGRWAHLRNRWGWIPGPPRSRAYYAPALVVFIGGDNFSLSISSGGGGGGIGWFPLGPREVYRPAYPVSRKYYEKINVSNTVINTTIINNTYNTNVTNIVHVNRKVKGAVIAVPAHTFVQSQPVRKSAVRVDREQMERAPTAFAPPLAPTEASVRGAAPRAGNPPPRVFERPVVARVAPPAVRAGFAAQQPHLTAKPGKPLDDDTRRTLRSSTRVAEPSVKVVAPSRIAKPTSRPPPRKDTRAPGKAMSPPHAQPQEPGRAQQGVPHKSENPRANPYPTPPRQSPGEERPHPSPHEGQSEPRGQDPDSLDPKERKRRNDQWELDEERRKQDRLGAQQSPSAIH